MKKYRVETEKYFEEFDKIEKAESYFNYQKDELMSDGVVADETFVELTESVDAFENHKVIKKVIAVVDNERHELGTPREEGFDWDYWAKWQEVVEEGSHDTQTISRKQIR
jgi:hypothetical protein